MDLKEMSLRQKIGQLMMVGFHGTEPSKDILRMIEEEHVGGIILFVRNIGTPKEVLQLTSDLQMRAKQAGQPLPLLISIDQENGSVRRLGEGTTVFPGNMLLGAADEDQVTRDIAKATADELNALGINMNFAPVLDVNNNPHNPVIGVRSFGEAAEDVSRHGMAYIKGYREAGGIPTIKHFPGHGDTATDSHLALPIIPHDLERLKEVELLPFQRAIEAGVDCVMSAHISFPALEPKKGVPATLSHSVITGLLREKMGFDGVVTTDCLEMDAISGTVGTAEGALQALRAGVDILLVSHTHAVQKETIEHIAQAVEAGELQEEVIDRAVSRILRLKEQYVSWDSIPSAGGDDLSTVGNEAHRKRSEQAYARGVTLLKNDDDVLPLSSRSEQEWLVIVPSPTISNPAEDPKFAEYRLADAIRRHRPRVSEVRINVSPTEEEFRVVEQRAQSYEVILFGTLNTHLHPRQADLVNYLLDMGKQVIAVAMQAPYDLMAIPGVSASIATYEHTYPALCVAADIIFGKKRAKGKLPVTIPGVANRGGGIRSL